MRTHRLGKIFATNTSDKELTSFHNKERHSPIKHGERAQQTSHRRWWTDANKHKKRCSPSHVIKDSMQIKQQGATATHRLESLEPETPAPPHAGEDVEPQDLSFTVATWHSHCGEQAEFLTDLNMLSPCDPAVALLGISPNEVKTYLPTKPCTQIFTAALCIITQTWKQPRCPSGGAQTNQSPQTMGCFSQMRHQAVERHGLAKTPKEWLEGFVGSWAETNQFYPPNSFCHMTAARRSRSTSAVTGHVDSKRSA